MSDAVSIVGQGGKIVIEVFGYENPSASNVDDANWLSSRFSVEVGPFAGSFKAALTTYDLLVLCERMETVLRTLSGQLSYQSTEDNLTLEAEFARNGTVELKGVVQPSGSYKAALHYRFESEPGHLSRTLQELKLLTEKFPAKQESSTVH
jgi:hypothetical protein